ncbi:putative transcriptional regulator [Sulfolobus polyhedral virus 1]|uniref:Ribbon-helix-helix domain n=2 Tax=Alphaportoglobovirus TaxID=2169647 RepID=A0A3Q8Q457_9VIRU|nr:putative transcriptional regulator [Sulfolobus polyhedral virus 1]YP_010084272.1 ribbon-helix-helix domain [Sulfolobus polyhedral virus 2]ARM37805.1 putative transcriptional regulator [Sulfolobus polyhedral virus 1]AZI76021.1 ribbon-helix-helix domain [Sulfolobus polyhedral virus 2]
MVSKISKPITVRISCTAVYLINSEHIHWLQVYVATHNEVEFDNEDEYLIYDMLSSRDCRKSFRIHKMIIQKMRMIAEKMNIDLSTLMRMLLAKAIYYSQYEEELSDYRQTEYGNI